MSTVNSQKLPKPKPLPTPYYIYTTAPAAESTEIPASPQNKGFLCPVFWGTGGNFPDLAGSNGGQNPGRQERPLKTLPNPWWVGELRIAPKSSLGLWKDTEVHLLYSVQDRTRMLIYSTILR